MIISFDGNVFAGKSTLIRMLSPLFSMPIIGEHSDYLGSDAEKYDGTDLNSALLLQTCYLGAEEKRCAATKPGANYFLDRSFVSMAAHVSALMTLSGIDMREWFLNELEQRLLAGKVLVPDVFCFVRCGNDLIRKRALSNASRGTSPLYYEEKYLAFIDRFNEAWSARVQGVVIGTDGTPPIGLVQTLIQQKKLSSQGSCSVQKICEFLRDILMQDNATKTGGM
jgi:deoxyadenosine/deoxycytidine kinase